ncbi:MAG TPA: energy transducer TonB [Terriglobales bacterium]|nr:energy transducer TonB [Terriglobales bacterium]
MRLLVERDPASPEFRSGVRAVLHPTDLPGDDEFDLWRDVFVQQKLPWGRFLQSALLHAAAVALLWTITLSWIRQQKILDPTAFDRSSLVTYSPEEYLPPLDTGASEAPKMETGDPAYAKQPILSVPPEADNRSQTIVVPPDLKLDRDVALPNIVATGAIVPAVPLDATLAPLTHIVATETQVVAPAPDVEFAADRVVRAAMKSDVIAPPPEVTPHHTRGVAGPETAVVEPPPQLTPSTKGQVGLMNIGPSEVVAPAPQLTLTEQHSLAARGKGRLPGGGVQPVGPPPSVAAAGSASGGGRLIALGIHPVAPTGPVAVPRGNRRGTFAATPQGKPGASGTPDLAGSKSEAKGSGARGGGSGSFNARHNGSLPAGLHVGAADSGATSPVERNGRASSNGNGENDPREMASLSTAGAGPGSRSGARAASPVSDDKITDVDRKVFAGKRVYGRTLNMPNLNSSTGSWVIKFAELDGGRKEGELLEPVATEKPDPGYPLELMRANVHGVVTLYAVIHADGKVGDIRVLNSPDERLDSYAAKALAGWKFVPAERAGKPVALEAVVEIPFRVRRSF